jgi:hypothetical protein
MMKKNSAATPQLKPHHIFKHHGLPTHGDALQNGRTLQKQYFCGVIYCLHYFPDAVMVTYTMYGFFKCYFLEHD